VDPPNPRPLLQRLLIFILVDLFGMFCLVLGVVWLVSGYRFPLMRFPNNSSEAFVSVAGGLAVSVWAVAKLLSALRSRAE